MRFCVKCDNMYYIKITDTDSDKIMLYCRNCGNEDDISNSETICVFKTDISNEDTKYEHIINKFTKNDPSLPRTNKIKCPNTSCKSLDDDLENDIIFLRYDDINMKYIYVCNYCNTIWKTDEQK